MDIKYMSKFLIIGATSTIGSCVAKKLIHSGHEVYLIGRDPAKTESIAKDLNCRFAIADASQFDSVDKVVGRL
jgi:short-subunit dehydrogenase